MPRYSSAIERFWAKVEFTEECWLWSAALDSSGYGVFKDKRRYFKAHRWAYALYGCIPPGLELDHLCRIRQCVRPEHLEPVTAAENSRRIVRVLVDACYRGHQLTPENSYTWNGGPRKCIRCRRIRDRERRARRKS